MLSQSEIQRWNEDSNARTLAEVLGFAKDHFGQRLTFACSFGFEDMLILDELHRADIDCNVFYLETGRLHEETYSLIAEAEKYYGKKFSAYSPEAKDIENFVNTRGINSFYDSIENRKLCCEIRKVKPLNRALEGKTAWITGLRRQQSPARAHLEFFEIDGNDRVKVSPLRDWSWEQMKQHQELHGFPISELHRRGFTSIGCAPCTRPVSPTSDFREGRWWWEQESAKECGLHSYR